MSFVPYAVSWNLTQRCNLLCEHCYMDAGEREKGGPDELSTKKALEIVGQIAEVNPGAVLILTGGEPLMRADIYDIASKASGLGMMVVLGTNGTMLTAETVKKLKESGVSGIGISIDSLDETLHDSFRGLKGALKKSIAGLEAARDGGLEVQVQTTPTTKNLDEIPKIAEWAHNFGAKVFNLFFLVCTGRGEEMADITPEEYEKVLKWAVEAQSEFSGMMIRPKCAPHFKRILYQTEKNHPLLSTYIAACRAGTHYCRITPNGEVTPCPYMPQTSGDLKEVSFKEIWEESSSLTQFRTPEYGGKCGLCAYRLLCGGCRARAYAELGDVMQEDQWCVYEPIAMEKAIENPDTQAKFATAEPVGDINEKWSDEAKEKLSRMPVFARSIVQKASEKYADDNNIDEITVEVMRTAAPPPAQFVGKNFGKPTGKIEDGRKDKEERKEDDVEWDEDAKARLEDAPDFVRPGIRKLMQKRARERSQKKITTEFLTEIRNESMMLVTRRVKKMGFDKMEMSAWDKAKDIFKKSSVKKETIDTIASFLDKREVVNEDMIKKFESYLEDDSKSIGWEKEAKERLAKAPFFVRNKAKAFIEQHAKENGYRYVTLKAVEEAMANLPMGKMFSKPNKG